MSGSPKYSSTHLAAEQAARLRQLRAEQAQREAQMRTQAAEEERQRQLRSARERAQTEATALYEQLDSSATAVFPQDRERLITLTQSTRVAIAQATAIRKIQNLCRETAKHRSLLEEAIARKARADAEQQRRDSLAKSQWLIAETARTFRALPPSEVRWCDSNLRRKAAAAIEEAQRLLTAGDAIALAPSLAAAESAVQTNLEVYRERKEAWTQRKMAAEAALSEFDAISGGLHADTLAVRWQKEGLAAMAALRERFTAAISEERFEETAQLLELARQHTDQTIAAANAAQIQADQRDYVTASIRATLAEMGFDVSDAREEHPGAPNTAMLLSANTASGKAIYVSVPVQGEVWYDVEGYTKTTETSVGAGRAAACDEAEAVLNEMRSRLSDEFGVEAGEILWEGKNPNRTLKTHKGLPLASEKTQGGQR